MQTAELACCRVDACCSRSMEGGSPNRRVGDVFVCQTAKDDAQQHSVLKLWAGCAGVQSEGGEHRRRALLQRKGSWSNTRLPALLLMLYCCCLLQQAEFNASVEQGFQASPTWHQGSILAAEAGAAGPKMSTGTLPVLWGVPASHLRNCIICCNLNMSQPLSIELVNTHILTSHCLLLCRACIVLCLVPARSPKLLLGPQHDPKGRLGRLTHSSSTAARRHQSEGDCWLAQHAECL